MTKPIAHSIAHSPLRQSPTPAKIPLLITTQRSLVLPVRFGVVDLVVTPEQLVYELGSLAPFDDDGVDEPKGQFGRHGIDDRLAGENAGGVVLVE